MSVVRQFSRRVLDALADAKILGVRAGPDHKYTSVWVVVVEGRVFARSWSDTPTGWYRACLEEPRGSIRYGEVERRVRAVPTRSRRLQDAVSAAFGEKYDTKASRKWVKGFARPGRAAHTIQFVPR